MSSKEEDKVKRYAVLAKNCETEKGVQCYSSDLYNLDDKLETAWDFKPSSKTDFKPKTIYGKIIGDDIVDHYILHMSDTMEDLQTELAAMKKKPNPKVRFSFTAKRRPLKSIQMRREKNEDKARQTAERRALKEAKNFQNDAILSTCAKVAANVKQGGFNKEQHLSPQNGATPSINGSVSEMELSDEQIAATSTSNHSVSEMKVSNEQAAAASIISSISSDLATEGITETFLSSPLSESQKVDTESNGDSSKAQPLPSEVTAVQADAGTGCISDKPDECADATMNADTDCNGLCASYLSLMEEYQKKENENSDLKSQLDMALSDAEKYRLLHDDERAKNIRNEKAIRELKEEKNKVMMHIKEKVDKLPNVIEQNIKKNTEECYLEDVQQFTIPLEDAFKELELADNEIYLGNGYKFTRDDLYEVGSKSSFLSKVGALMPYFFPDGPENYSLSGKSKYANKKVTAIKETTRENMKCILRKLPECLPVTSSKLNEALKYHTNMARSKKWGKVGITRAKRGEGKGKKRKIDTPQEEEGQKPEKAARDEVDLGEESDSQDEKND